MTVLMPTKDCCKLKSIAAGAGGYYKGTPLLGGLDSPPNSKGDSSEGSKKKQRRKEKKTYGIAVDTAFEASLMFLGMLVNFAGST